MFVMNPPPFYLHSTVFSVVLLFLDLKQETILQDKVQRKLFSSCFQTLSIILGTLLDQVSVDLGVFDGRRARDQLLRAHNTDKIACGLSATLCKYAV